MSTIITINGPVVSIDANGDGHAETVVDTSAMTISYQPDGPNPPPPVVVHYCFMTGTMISTPNGDVAVETLKRGDMVTTSTGAAMPVRWMGRQTVSQAFAGSRSNPICIKAGALGDNLPARDLFVSPAHALLVDGVLVEAGALVNGSSIVRAEAPETFVYHHIELADHSLVVAEGVAAETFVDNAARMSFDNWQEYDALPDAAPIQEMDLPRVTASRQVPAATQRRLAERAEALFGKSVAKAA